jgi:hypothetical protein
VADPAINCGFLLAIGDRLSYPADTLYGVTCMYRIDHTLTVTQLNAPTGVAFGMAKTGVSDAARDITRFVLAAWSAD